MARRTTIEFFPALYDGIQDTDDLYLSTGSKTKAVFVDGTSGDKIIIQGKNFDYEKGIITDGTMQSITLMDAGGDKLQSISNFRVDARFVQGDSILEQVDDLLPRLLNGNMKFIGSSVDDAFTASGGKDLLSGRGGDDTLGGGAGRDRLTGGAGNDNFVFNTGDGKDIITDFDADGGAGLQDHIDATFPGAGAISQAGKNTIIDFGSGDVLTLLNVKATQIDVTDFV